MDRDRVRSRGSCLFILLLAAAFLGVAAAQPAQAQPVVKTVPWVATNPLIPHDIIGGVQTRLKGTVSDTAAGTLQYTWDFGDGAPVATGPVANGYAVEAVHTYTGAAGTLFTARLTVVNTTTGLSASRPYYVILRATSLPVRVNVAIDEGLWYLHKTQQRTVSGTVPIGYWSGGYAGSGYYGPQALNVNAFEVNGHLATGTEDNPYTETVARGVNRLFQYLTYANIGLQTTGLGSFNPDANGNGIAVLVNQYPDLYQLGMFVDALVASGTPNAIATLGGANVIGRTYRSIVQDMVDWYAYAQYDGAGGGGWRYSYNQFPDNSACQWAAIAIIPAMREWGIVLPQIVRDWNVVWLQYSQNPVNGVFGYTDRNPIWGPYATTPSGMVQMAMDGIGRGNAMWDRTETFMRDNFGNTGGATLAVRDYYYGLFSFVKALLLHDSNNDGVSEPITLLQSSTPGVVPIDWYAAEAGVDGATTHGVARTLVDDQAPDGYWYGHNYDGNQMLMETAMAIIMLNRTIFQAGAPVAVAQAVPNPGVAGQVITLDGSASYHQDASKAIDSWQWDLDNDGTFETDGPFVTRSWPAVGDYVVRLRVTDNASPEAESITQMTVLITTPPVAPTANAGGPYTFCLGTQNWFVDGTGSVNPDDGQHQPGTYPPDFLTYAWDLDGDGQFDDAVGAQPNIFPFFNNPVGSYLIQLQVTDNTAASFPASGMGNLSDTDTAVVNISSTCACINNLAARAKLTKIQLTWAPWSPLPHHYNIYRSTTDGGPYLYIGQTTSTYSTYLDTSSLALGTTYYYVVRPASFLNVEVCQSNQASARPATR